MLITARWITLRNSNDVTNDRVHYVIGVKVTRVALSLVARGC